MWSLRFISLAVFEAKCYSDDEGNFCLLWTHILKGSSIHNYKVFQHGIRIIFYKLTYKIVRVVIDIFFFL